MTKPYRISKEGFIIRTEDNGTIPPDIENTSYKEYLDWLEEGNTAEPYVPTFQEIYQQLDSEVSRYYDTVAKQKKYDDRLTCALRAGYEGPFQHEGIAFARWMDSCNVICYSMLEEVKNGTRPIPTIEEVIAEFPTIEWTEK